MRAFGGQLDPSKMKVDQLATTYDYYSQFSDPDGPAIVFSLNNGLKLMDSEEDRSSSEEEDDKEPQVSHASALEETGIAAALQRIDDDGDSEDDVPQVQLPILNKVQGGIISDRNTKPHVDSDQGEDGEQEGDDVIPQGDKDHFPCTWKKSSQDKNKFLGEKLVDDPEFVDLVQAYANNKILKVGELSPPENFC